MVFDEARHVALGVLYLPDVLRRMSLASKAELARWQLSLYLLQLDVLKERLAAEYNLPIEFEMSRFQVALIAILFTLLGAAFEVREAWSQRVSTGRLNRWFEEAIERNPPPAPGGKRIKLRYITQVNTRPPSFVLFGTRVDQLPDSYLRYLVNGIRKELGFGAVPVRLAVRASRNPYGPGGER